MTPVSQWMRGSVVSGPDLSLLRLAVMDCGGADSAAPLPNWSRMRRGHGSTDTDFGKTLLAAIAKAEQQPPRSLEDRAVLWEQGWPLSPQERTLHGIPDGQEVVRLDEVLSLAHALPSLSKAERAAFFALVVAIAADLKSRRALVRKARREGWLRLARMAAQAAPKEPPKQAEAAGVVLPIAAAQSGVLLDSWILNDDAFLIGVGERSGDAPPQSELEAAWQALKRVQPIVGAVDIALGADDIELALGWTSPEHQQAVNGILKRRGDARAAALGALSWDTGDKLFRELHRCLAARHAELLVARLLRSWGASVEDTSILAHVGRDDRRWQTHDLEVDGVPVDVKNVTFDRRDRQSWAQIKRFRAAVRYDAVRTPWLASLRPFLDAHVGVDTEYLGSVDQQEMSAFSRIAEPPLSLEIEKPIQSGRSKFAGWCFALPSAAYHEWDRAFSRLLATIGVPSEGRPRLALPQLAVLRARGVVASLQPEELAQKESLRGVGRIADAVAQFGRAPRVLVAALLNELQLHLRGAGLVERSLLTNLFPFGPRVPLGVFDPSKSVLAFLTALLRLVETPGALDGVVSVQLMSPRWLRGTTAKGFKVTLITNCLHCSEFPLIRGQSETCRHGNGRLVCPNGHCC